MTPPSSPEPPRSSAGLLLVAWLFVGIPLVWGVTQTLFKAMALFH
jgi:hypothetical protein